MPSPKRFRGRTRLEFEIRDNETEMTPGSAHDLGGCKLLERCFVTWPTQGDQPERTAARTEEAIPAVLRQARFRQELGAGRTPPILFICRAASRAWRIFTQH
jgi:hypothetical protein